MDTALTDVNNALSTIRNKITVFSSHAKQANVRHDFTKQAITDNRDAATKISTSLQIEEARAALLAQRRQLLIGSAITSSLTYNGNSLLDIVQRPTFAFKI